MLQGLSLPFLIRKLGLREDTSESVEEDKARVKAAQAALDRMDELAAEDWVREDTVDRLRRAYVRVSSIRTSGGTSAAGVEDARRWPRQAVRTPKACVPRWPPGRKPSPTL